MIDFKSLAKKRRNTTACVEVLSLVKEIIQKCNILGKITEQMCHKCNTLRIFQNLLFTTFWKVSRAIINQLFLPRMSRFKPKWDMILFTTNIQVQAKVRYYFFYHECPGSSQSEIWYFYLEYPCSSKVRYDIFLPRISRFKQSEIWFFTTNIQVQVKVRYDIFYHEYQGSSKVRYDFFTTNVQVQAKVRYEFENLALEKHYCWILSMR